MSEGILFVEELPNIFKCPNSNCLKIMIDAVTVKCGHSFCKKCALSIDKCPIDNYKIDKKNCFPNLVLSSQLQDMLIHCSNGVKYNPMNQQLVIDETGCQEKISLKNKDIHENQCPFRIVHCPFNNNKCKEKMRFNDIESHKQNCQYSQKTNNLFIYSKSEISNKSLGQKMQFKISEDKPDMQQIADNLTFRIKRLETQMNGSLNRMENMFFEIHSGMQFIINHLNMLPDYEKSKRESTASSSPSSYMDNKFNEINRPIPQLNKNNLLSLKEVANISGIMSNSGGISDTYQSSHWICPFSFLNAGILKGHHKMITSLTQFENFIITSSQDQTIRIWDISFLIQGEFGKTLTNGGCVAILTGHNFSISCLAITRLSREIISIDAESNLKIWEFSSGLMVREKEKLHEKPTTSVAVSKSIIFTGSNAEIRMWDLISLEQVGCVVNHINHFIRCLVLNQPQENLLYSSGHNQVLVWQVKLTRKVDSKSVHNVTLDLMKSIEHSFYGVYSMVISARYIIIGTYNKNIQVFNNGTGEHLFSLAGHVAQVNGLCLTSSETHLVSVAADGCINIWELDRRTLIQSINVGTNYCGQAVTIIGDVLFICGSDAEIKIYRYDRLFS